MRKHDGTMLIPETPEIEEAATRLIELEKIIQQAKGGGRRSANGTEEHLAFSAAMDMAYESEGLTLVKSIRFDGMKASGESGTTYVNQYSPQVGVLSVSLRVHAAAFRRLISSS